MNGIVNKNFNALMNDTDKLMERHERMDDSRSKNDLVSSRHQPSHIHMEARHWDGSCHEIAIWVAEDVAEAGCSLRVFPKESEFVSHLECPRANSERHDIKTAMILQPSSLGRGLCFLVPGGLRKAAPQRSG